MLGIDDALLERNTSALKALVASEITRGNACSSSSRLLQRRMPRPPPPEVALSITGQSRSARLRAGPRRDRRRYLRCRGCRHAGGDHAAAGFGLVAHAADHLRRRADELDTALGADFRQLGIFREEAITGVQWGVAAAFHRQVHQGARVEVAGQRVRADAVGFVGALDVQRVAIGLGVDGHRADAHLRRRRARCGRRSRRGWRSDLLITEVSLFGVGNPGTVDSGYSGRCMTGRQLLVALLPYPREGD